MASKGLTEVWNGAMAAKPSEWELRGVVLGPHDAEPVIRGKSWIAWATGPGGQSAVGTGDSPHEALTALTVALRNR